MSLTERVPGMKPGATARNGILVVAYLFAAMFVIALLPIVVGAIVGTNYRGSADRLAAIPGIEQGGGLKTGAVAGVIGLVIWGVMLGAGGSTDDTGNESEPAQVSGELEDAGNDTAADNGTSDETGNGAEAANDTESDDGTYSLTVTVLNESEEPIQNATVEIMHDDAILFRTVEDNQTDEQGQVVYTVENGTHDIEVTAEGYESNETKISTESEDELTVQLAEIEEESETATETDTPETENETETPTETETSTETETETETPTETPTETETETQTQTDTPTETETPTPTETETPTPTETSTEEPSVSTAGEAQDILEVSGMNVEGANADEEYIELRNTGDVPIDMSGWQIRDRREDGVVDGRGFSPVNVPSGFTLGPGETVTVITGEGTNTDDTLYWGYNQQNWREEGDVIIVLDRSGNVALEHAYSDQA